MRKNLICIGIVCALLLCSCDSSETLSESTDTTTEMSMEVSIESESTTIETTEITETTTKQTTITTTTVETTEETTEESTIATDSTTEATTKATKAPTKATTVETTEEPTTTTTEVTEPPTTTTEATEAPTTTTEVTTTTTETSKTDPGTLGDTSGSFNKEMAKEVLTLVNNERAANGLAPLSWGSTLAKAADIRATELVVSFSHTRPDGSEWWTAGAQTQMGENLGFGQQSASEVVSAWMESSMHRDNILSSHYTSLGVSCYYCNGTYYWVQEFA